MGFTQWQDSSTLRPRVFPIRSVAQLMSLVALSGLAMSTFPHLQRAAGPPRRVIVRQAPRVWTTAATGSDARMIVPAPSGIDERFIVAAPTGIDDRMIVPPGRMAGSPSGR